MLAAAAAARGAGQRRRGADAADQHLRAVRVEDPAAPAGRLRATPCPVTLSPGAPRQDAASAGHGAQLAPVLSAQLSIPSPSRLLPPKSPPASGLASHVHRLSSKASSRVSRWRLPPSEGPAVLLAPQAPLSSGCASQRLRHSWDAAREVFVIDPSSPRPGLERFRAGSRRSVAFSGCCLFALPSQSAAFRCPADPRRPPQPSVPPPCDSPHSGASPGPSRRVHTPPPLHPDTCSPA